MGTPVAPSLANLFMGALERDLLNSVHIKPLSWKRFIDDIHFIWTDIPETCTSFQEHMNNIYPTIKFNFEVSSSQVPFLDTVTKVKNNRIEAFLYTKPTDKHP